MFVDPKISTVAYVIQLSVAPVFFLSGVSVTLSVLTNRLARVIDRARKFEAELILAPTERATSELSVLTIRARLINRAITQCVACSLSVCLVIATLFLGATFSYDVSLPVAGLFLAALGLFVGSMLSFLREIFLATKSLRFDAHVGVSGEK